MTDRDELADVIHPWVHEPTCTGCDYAKYDTDDMITAILVRWRLVPVIPDWSARVAFPHETPIPCYEDDLSRCGCSTCINEPKIPGKRPITEQQRRDRFLTPNVHPPKFAMRHADGCDCHYDLDRERHSDSPLYRD